MRLVRDVFNLTWGLTWTRPGPTWGSCDHVQPNMRLGADASRANMGLDANASRANVRLGVNAFRSNVGLVWTHSGPTCYYHQRKTI
jgi:hypothetical protein